MPSSAINHSPRTALPQSLGTGRRRLTIELAVSVIASFVASAILLFVMSVGVVVSVLVGAILLGTLGGFYLGANRAPGVPEQLARAGIRAVAIDRTSKLSVEDILPSTKHTLCFWGISGKRTTSSQPFRQWVEDLPKTQIRARFLLFDPTSSDLVRKAEDEGDNPDSWKQEIAAVLSRLSATARRFPQLIEVRVYSEFPIWRVIFVDDQMAIVNYFPSGKQGPDSTQLVLERGRDSLYEALHKEFAEVWEHRSTRVAP